MSSAGLVATRLAAYASNTAAATPATGNAYPVLSLCAFSGADVGAQLNAAISSLPSTGGVVDARCLGDTAAISTTVTVDRPVQLLLGATHFTVSAAVGFDASADFAVEGMPVAGLTEGSSYPGQGVSWLEYTNATGVLFRLGQTGAGAALKTFSLRNLEITATGSTTSVAVLLRMAVNSVFENLVFNNWYGCFQVTGNGSDDRGGENHWSRINIQSTTADLSGQFGFQMDHVYDSHFSNVLIFFKDTSPYGVNGIGWIFDRGADTVYMNDCQSALGAHGMVLQNTAPSYSAVYDGNPINFFVKGFLADSQPGGSGILFDSSLGGENVRFYGLEIWAAGAGQDPGGSSTPVTAGAVGIQINGGSDIQIFGGTVRVNAYHGIHVNTPGSIVLIDGMSINANDLYAVHSDTCGILIETSTAHARVVNCQIQGSTQKYGISVPGTTNNGLVIVGNNTISNGTQGINNQCQSPNQQVFGNSDANIGTYPYGQHVLNGNVGINEFNPIEALVVGPHIKLPENLGTIVFGDAASSRNNSAVGIWRADGTGLSAGSHLILQGYDFIDFRASSQLLSVPGALQMSIQNGAVNIQAAALYLQPGTDANFYIHRNGSNPEIVLDSGASLVFDRGAAAFQFWVSSTELLVVETSKVDVRVPLYMNGTEVMDTSRNLVNIASFQAITVNATSGFELNGTAGFNSGGLNAYTHFDIRGGIIVNAT